MSNRRLTSCLTLSGFLLAAGSPVFGNAGVTFREIATDAAAGLAYERYPSASEAEAEALRQGVYTIVELIESPDSPRGLPGVVLFDADRDGDVDLYVTNGPGAPNGFFLNQLRETGEVRFVDEAVAAGVAATEQDSTGACAGDLDNDGDPDLLVLGNSSPNLLFDNLGDGIFEPVADSALGGVGYHSASCAFGDVDGDGLLDVFLSNFFDPQDRRPIVIEQFDLSHPNQLYRNLGDLGFEDVSAESGILDLHLPPEAPDVAATVTWVAALADFDGDTDLDILQIDDHGAPPFSANGGIDRGFLQLFENDGTGHFTNVTAARGLADANGDWMGVAVGDFDHNGRLDFFSSNLGNQSSLALIGPGWPRNEQRDSRHFLQGDDGVFTDTSPDGHLHNPFGWGTSVLDLENDGDLDIIYHGGFDLGVVIMATPAVVMVGDGTGAFVRDRDAFARSTDHLRRNVRSMAVGDLDENGFDDVVSVSNFDIPESVPMTLLPPLGGDFDDDSYIVDHFLPIDPTPPRILQPHVWQGYQFPNGSLSVELNNGESGHGSVRVRLVGTVGVTTDGRASRDPYGAVVEVTPRGGAPILRPLLGGSSMAAQDSPLMTFGLGDADSGQVDVQWPGGHRNRFFLNPGSSATLPEIPCTFDDLDASFVEYFSCVRRSLTEMIGDEIVPPERRVWFEWQALWAWWSVRWVGR